VRRRVLGSLAFALCLVVGVAACGGGGSSSGYTEPKGPAVAQLTFDARNFAFTPDKASAPAGIIGITLKSTSGGHDFVIQDLAGFKLTTPGSGDTDSGKVELKKGKYTFYCSLPGHRAAGMQGTLTIT
jgi:plastocyanin